MIGNIKEIENNIILVSIETQLLNIENLMDSFVFIQDKTQNFIGQIISISITNIRIKLIGEFKENVFINGNIKKPSLGSKVYLMSNEFVKKIMGYDESDDNTLLLGNSALYKEIAIGLNINNFFSNHYAILGTTGMGKSCGFTKIMESLFINSNPPINSHFFIFDAYGEYHNSILNITNNNSNINFKIFSTKPSNGDEALELPLWLMDVDDVALLLNVENPSNLFIIEKALKLAYIFVGQSTESLKYKNHIIANALIEILLSGKPSSQIRDQFIGCLSKYYTESLNAETKIVQPGYIRTLRQCLLIDEDNKIRAIDLIVEFLKTYLINDFELPLLDGSVKFDLKDLIYSFDFALIDEGMWNNARLFELTNTLRVRLNTLYNSDYGTFFEISDYYTKEGFIKRLITNKSGLNCQIVNFNISYVDDRFAKTIVKIYSKMLFNYAKNNEKRLSFPINIVLEEAHRYVQNDNDVNIIGYNIFDRIVKEGRKYAVSLGVISQRPSELSETTLSQCSNFILFRMNHPRDIEFIEGMIPNMTKDVINIMKELIPGISIVFGNAFKLTTLVKFEIPIVMPESNSGYLKKIWY